MTRSQRHGTDPGTFHFQLDTTFLDPTDIPDPIERLLAEHYRARALCRILAGLADDPLHPGHRHAAGIVAGYLSTDHPLHVADEVEGLIPLLRRRREDAEATDACAYLAREHDRDSGLARPLIGELRLMADGLPPRLPLNFIVTARTLARNLARHLTWENGFLMPLARRSLVSTDLASLDRDMRARRDRHQRGTRESPPPAWAAADAAAQP